MWARVKGRTEDALLRLPFRSAYMFRPGFIEPLHGIQSKTRSYRIFYAVLRPLFTLLHRAFPNQVLTTEEVGLAMLLALLKPSDLLMITADHGCDPDPRWPTTDHSREYVPILAFSPGGKSGVALGVRDTLADMGQTIAQNFGGAIPHGTSFLSLISEN